MKKEERTIETVGRPNIESLPKDKADIFYMVLLSGVQTYYVKRCKSDDDLNDSRPESHSKGKGGEHSRRPGVGDMFLL